MPLEAIVAWLTTEPPEGGAARPQPPHCVHAAGFATRGEFAAALLHRVRGECEALFRGTPISERHPSRSSYSCPLYYLCFLGRS